MSPKFATKCAVIPAKLAIASVSRNQEIQRKLDYRFRGNDERETSTYSANSETGHELISETGHELIKINSME